MSEQLVFRLYRRFFHPSLASAGPLSDFRADATILQMMYRSWVPPSLHHFVDRMTRDAVQWLQDGNAYLVMTLEDWRQWRELCLYVRCCLRHHHLFPGDIAGEAERHRDRLSRWPVFEGEMHALRTAKAEAAINELRRRAPVSRPRRMLDLSSEFDPALVGTFDLSHDPSPTPQLT